MTTAHIESITYNSDGWDYSIDGQPLRPLNALATLTLVVPVKDLANINPQRPVTLTQQGATND